MRFPCIIAVLTTLTVPLLAEQTDRSGWQYDAVMPDHLSDTSSPTAADINAINDLLAKLRDCWNAHDLNAYLALYWNSPQLVDRCRRSADSGVAGSARLLQEQLPRFEDDGSRRSTREFR